MGSIKITITESGEVNLEGVGFSGNGCKRLLGEIGEGLVLRKDKPKNTKQATQQKVKR